MSDAAINQSKRGARAVILKSIRDQLAESALRDAASGKEKVEQTGVVLSNEGSSIAVDTVQANGQKNNLERSLVRPFREQLEAVGGHCLVVSGQVEAARALNSIIAELQTTPLPTQRIALSDAPLVERLMRETGVKVDEITTSPSAPDLFGYDIGLTAAQAAIAETGTLVLESDYERHRLVSLLPPVHIAVIDAADICPTLGDALRRVRRRGPMEMSRAITFVTGPSRTADIELTLTIGVHGPRELYVIVNEGPPLTTD